MSSSSFDLKSSSASPILTGPQLYSTNSGVFAASQCSGKQMERYFMVSNRDNETISSQDKNKKGFSSVYCLFCLVDRASRPNTQARIVYSYIWREQQEDKNHAVNPVSCTHDVRALLVCSSCARVYNPL